MRLLRLEHGFAQPNPRASTLIAAMAGLDESEGFEESTAFYRQFSKLQAESEELRAELRAGKAQGDTIEADARADLLRRANDLLERMSTYRDAACQRLLAGGGSSNQRAMYEALPKTFAQSIERFVSATSVQAVAPPETAQPASAHHVVPVASPRQGTEAPCLHPATSAAVLGEGRCVPSPVASAQPAVSMDKDRSAATAPASARTGPASTEAIDVGAAASTAFAPPGAAALCSSGKTEVGSVAPPAATGGGALTMEQRAMVAAKREAARSRQQQVAASSKRLKGSEDGFTPSPLPAPPAVSDLTEQHALAARPPAVVRPVVQPLTASGASHQAAAVAGAAPLQAHSARAQHPPLAVAVPPARAQHPPLAVAVPPARAQHPPLVPAAATWLPPPPLPQPPLPPSQPRQVPPQPGPRQQLPPSQLRLDAPAAPHIAPAWNAPSQAGVEPPAALELERTAREGPGLDWRAHEPTEFSQMVDEAWQAGESGHRRIDAETKRQRHRKEQMVTYVVQVERRLIQQYGMPSGHTFGKLLHMLKGRLPPRLLDALQPLRHWRNDSAHTTVSRERDERRWGRCKQLCAR